MGTGRPTRQTTDGRPTGRPRAGTMPGTFSTWRPPRRRAARARACSRCIARPFLAAFIAVRLRGIDRADQARHVLNRDPNAMPSVPVRASRVHAEHTSPPRSSSGPPLLPGLMAASVWTMLTPSIERMPLTMPRVTVLARPAAIDRDHVGANRHLARVGERQHDLIEIRDVQLEHREINVMSDGLDARGPRIAAGAFQRDDVVAGDDVRVGDDRVGRDEDPLPKPSRVTTSRRPASTGSQLLLWRETRLLPPRRRKLSTSRVADCRAALRLAPPIVSRRLTGPGITTAAGPARWPAPPRLAERAQHERGERAQRDQKKKPPDAWAIRFAGFAPRPCAGSRSSLGAPARATCRLIGGGEAAQRLRLRRAARDDRGRRRSCAPAPAGLEPVGDAARTLRTGPHECCHVGCRGSGLYYPLAVEELQGTPRLVPEVPRDERCGRPPRCRPISKAQDHDSPNDA